VSDGPACRITAARSPPWWNVCGAQCSNSPATISSNTGLYELLRRLPQTVDW